MLKGYWIKLILIKSISKKKLSELGILIGLGFPIIIGWIIPKIGSHDFRFWSLYIGIPSLILGFLKPVVLFYPYKVWMALGHVLGWINSRIILGLVFIIVLQPIALIMRIFGHDPLRRKTNQKTISYKEIKKNHKIKLSRIF